MTRFAWPVFIALLGCQPVSIDLSGRACKGGACSDGYICHPETNLCVPAVAIDCSDPGALCPWTTSAGDSCLPIGAFLPCTDGRTDCKAGCRTCQEDETWSECTDPDCELGELWSCDRCDHDCRELVAHAEPACNTSQTPTACTYDGACLGGWVDADGRRDNGCECWPASREICNGADDDCNGSVDDGATCSGAAACENGKCVPCTEDDPSHCGASCLACAGETAACIDGTCQCTDATCDDGRWCDQGNCRSCDDADHCGSACVQCPQQTPACVAGSCECVMGSCPTGQYCDNGTCGACNCPTLFSACVDQGGAFVCRCTAASCGAGGSCEENATTCVYTDDFDGATSMLSLCGGNIQDSWQWGTPSIGVCRSAPACWVTNLAGFYLDCQISCVESPALDLDGVTGRIDIRFWARYLLESGFDGVTPVFVDDKNDLVVLEPAGGWDVATVVLGSGCGLAFHSWPAFGQYRTDAEIGWTEIHIGTDQTSEPNLFHDRFAWRVYLQADPAGEEQGWYMDDVEVRVTQVP